MVSRQELAAAVEALKAENERLVQEQIQLQGDAHVRALASPFYVFIKMPHALSFCQTSYPPFKLLFCTQMMSTKHLTSCFYT